MSALRQAAEDYLAVRRALGSKLPGSDRLLAGLAAYLEAAAATTVTTELALAWARLPGEDAHPAYLGKRLCVARGFARHLRAFDPATEIPPARLLPSRSCRAVPYLYSEADIAALMRAARSLRPALRAATYQTLIGLMFTTGLRIGEALRLDQDDLDWDEGLLRVWHSKFGNSRELPLHPTTLAALRVYASQRERLCPHPETAAFFVSAAGARLVLGTVQRTFSRLVRQAGLRARSRRCRPRPHDLRHSYACRVVLGWYRDGVDVDAQMPRLSTYLGHADPSGTYWYLSAVPELLALAAERRDHIPGRRA
jgi:integrase/recombinase XerD